MLLVAMTVPSIVCLAREFDDGNEGDDGLWFAAVRLQYRGVSLLVNELVGPGHSHSE